MPAQDSTVEIDGLAYVDCVPRITRAMVRLSSTGKTAVLCLGTVGDDSLVGVHLPPGAWVHVIPLLIKTLPEPFQAQAIAAVTQLGAEAVSA